MKHNFSLFNILVAVAVIAIAIFAVRQMRGFVVDTPVGSVVGGRDSGYYRY